MHTKAISRVVMVLCIVSGLVGLARGETVVLGYTGQPAPDGNGSYSTFTDPVLNNLGQAAVRAQLFGTSQGTDDDTAIVRVDAAGGTVICHENWPTSDFNGWFKYLYLPAINNLGQVAFRADAISTVMGPYDAVGIYRGTGGILPTQIVRGNDPSPDGNGCFLVMSDEPLLNDHGNSAFWASFTGTAGGLSDATAVVAHWLGALAIKLREGLPPYGGDGQFAGFISIALNQKNAIVCHASLRNTSGGASDNTGIFSAWAVPVELVREGDAAPDGNGEYRSFGLNVTLDQMDWGRPAFHARLRNTSGGTSDDSGIFLHTMKTTGIIRIAREGQSPPDGNGQYTNFDSDIAQNDQWVAFRAWMRNTAGGADDDEAIYRGDGTTTTKIVRAGQPAPGGNGVFQNTFDLVMNAPGHVAFQAQLAGTAGGSGDNRGLFIGNGTDLVEVARKGDPLLAGSIAELHLATGPACRNGLSDLGQVAYRAVLADGRELLMFYTPLVQWQGGKGGDWADNANWTLGILPGEPYDVAITPSGHARVAGPRADARVRSLTLGSTGGGTAVLELSYGGDLSAVATFTVTLGGKVQIGAGRTLSAANIVNAGILAFQPGQAYVRGHLTNAPAGQVLIPAGAEVWLQGRVENQGVVDVAPGAGFHTPGLTGNGCTGTGTVWLEANVWPGAGIGQMAFGGDVVFGRRCVTHLELGGRGLLPEYDEILVAGDLLLDGSLHLEFGAAPPPWLAPGQRLEIIDVVGTAAGEFLGLTEGAEVDVLAGLPVHITYAGGDGNDVELYVVPEPLAIGLLALGALALIRRRRCRAACDGRRRRRLQPAGRHRSEQHQGPVRRRRRPRRPVSTAAEQQEVTAAKFRGRETARRRATMKLTTTLAMLSLAVLVAAPAARADWDAKDPYKWLQLPDLTDWGMDVNATDPKVLADDFQCVQTNRITDIHLWGSWKSDDFDPAPTFKLSIHNDVPASSKTPYSTPGAELWSMSLQPTGIRSWPNIPEAWFDPNTGEYIPIDHFTLWQYNFDIPAAAAFEQKGTTTDPITYWLDVSYLGSAGGVTTGTFGWKTSIEHWQDDAVVGHLDAAGDPIGDWDDLLHPLDDGFSLDMAFVITPEPAAIGLLALGALAMIRRRRR